MALHSMLKHIIFKYSYVIYTISVNMNTKGGEEGLIYALMGSIL